MTLTVALNSEEEVQLLAQARAQGVSPDTLVREAVKKLLSQDAQNGCAEALGPDGLYSDERQMLERENTPERRRERAQAVAELRELRKGITLGPGLSIKDWSTRDDIGDVPVCSRHPRSSCSGSRQRPRGPSPLVSRTIKCASFRYAERAVTEEQIELFLARL